MRIVLDTNVFVSGIFWRGAPNRILNLWVKKKVQPVVSPAIIEEYRNTLTKLIQESSSEVSAEYWTLFVLEHATLVYPMLSIHVCRDPGDDKFLECAVSAEAKYLVSGDNDLLSLRKVEDVEILSPKDFLKKFS